MPPGSSAWYSSRFSSPRGSKRSVISATPGTAAPPGHQPALRAARGAGRGSSVAGRQQQRKPAGNRRHAQCGALHWAARWWAVCRHPTAVLRPLRAALCKHSSQADNRTTVQYAPAQRPCAELVWHNAFCDLRTAQRAVRCWACRQAQHTAARQHSTGRCPATGSLASLVAERSGAAAAYARQHAPVAAGCDEIPTHLVGAAKQVACCKVRHVLLRAIHAEHVLSGAELGAAAGRQVSGAWGRSMWMQERACSRGSV